MQVSSIEHNSGIVRCRRGEGIDPALLPGVTCRGALLAAADRGATRVAEQARRAHPEAAERSAAGQHRLRGEREAVDADARAHRAERVERPANGAAERCPGRQVRRQAAR